MHRQVEAAEALQRREIDAFDQLAEGVADFVAVLGLDRFVDRLGQGLIGRRCAGVEDDDRRGVRGGQQGRDLCPPGLQRIDGAGHVGQVHGPSRIGVVRAADAPADIAQFPIERRALQQRLTPGGVLVRVEGADGLGDGARRQQVALGAVDRIASRRRAGKGRKAGTGET